MENLKWFCFKLWKLVDDFIIYENNIAFWTLTMWQNQKFSLMKNAKIFMDRVSIGITSFRIGNVSSMFRPLL